MLRSRLLWKLYGGYALLVVLTAAVAGGLAARQIQRNARFEIEESLRAQVILLRESADGWLSDRQERSVQGQLRQLGQEIGVRLTLMRADGAVIADSQQDPSRMDNHANRPEILSARSRGFGSAERYSNTLGTHMLYMAVPLSDQSRLVGFIRASFPLDVVAERSGRLRNIVIFGVGVSALAALLLGLLFGQRLGQSLASMTEVAEAAADGDYDRRLPVQRNDEVGKLARAINRMAESSRRRMRVTEKERSTLAAILAGMVEGVVAVDASERILHMNQAAGKILGTDPGTSQAMRIWEVTRVSEVCQAVSKVLSGAAEVKKQLRLAGRPIDRVVEVHAAPLAGRQVQPTGAVVVLHDVTELQRLETVRRDFVSNVSHELKTPITAIRGLVETLIDDGDMPPKTQQRFLGKARDQTMRLSAIVTDLLTLSRLESGGDALQGQALSLREPVLGACDTLRPIAAERAISVEIDLPENPLRIMGDSEAIRQATGNLIDNALKYTPRKGRVWVRLRQEGSQAVIEVQDTGIGIEAREHQRIFERFYRVDKARSRKLGGTGLGLSIVKHIALTHGGRVWLESAPGQGSTFRIHLPLQSEGFTKRRKEAENNGRR